MSAFQQNYHKYILGVGACVMVALAGLGVFKILAVEGYKTDDQGTEGKKVQTPGLDKTKALLTSTGAKHSISRPALGAQSYDLFVGPVLFLQKGKELPVDIYSCSAIHGGVPNKWFLDHGLGDILAVSNALDLDTDNDGFTTKEEYDAKTDPSVAESHPLLLDKVELLGMTQKLYMLVFVGDAGEGPEFRLENKAGDRIWKVITKAGADFGDAPTQARFKLVSVDEQEFEDKTLGDKEKQAVAKILDQKPEKLGMVYQVREGSKHAQEISDKTVKLVVKAGNKRETVFSVEEGASFKIPGDDKAIYKISTINAKDRSASVKLEGGKTEERIIKMQGFGSKQSPASPPSSEKNL